MARIARRTKRRKQLRDSGYVRFSSIVPPELVTKKTAAQWVGDYIIPIDKYNIVTTSITKNGGRGAYYVHIGRLKKAYQDGAFAFYENRKATFKTKFFAFLKSL